MPSKNGLPVRLICRSFVLIFRRSLSNLRSKGEDSSDLQNMVPLKHSAVHWRLRCIDDSSSDVENTPPNISSNQHQDASAACSDTGTATPP
ncbi:hypothetical protein PC120_g26363 [Phytophthora cactorum]|nr:hypothetical protein PC120_g26363 [Phytophthora cactorum]